MSKQLAKSLNLPTYTSEGGSDCPFKITSSQSTQSSVTLNISPGTVNNIIPYNIFEEFTISNSGTHYVYIKGSGSVNTYHSPRIHISQLELINGAEMDSIPSTIYIKIGAIINGNIYNFSSCRGYWAVVNVTFKDSTDLINLRTWYTWVIL